MTQDGAFLIGGFVRINWSTEEMILAADVADDLHWRGVNVRVPEVVQLSGLLRSATYHPTSEREENFRSPGSVGMKVNNLRKSHPSHQGVGLRATAVEAEVVDSFLADRKTMKGVAVELRERIAEGRARLSGAKQILRTLS